MKKTLLAAAFALTASFLKAEGVLEFYTNITDLWWRGHKTNVLVIAEQRLACNSNDIAGLILKMEYDLEFLNLSSVSNSIQRVIDVGGGINSPIYSSNYYRYKFSLEDLLNLFAEPSMYVNVETDRAKSQLPKKRMLFERHLLSVCLDGLVTNYPALPPQSGATAP